MNGLEEDDIDSFWEKVSNEAYGSIVGGFVLISRNQTENEELVNPIGRSKTDLWDVLEKKMKNGDLL